MLTELCQELRNWFVKEKFIGTFTLNDGEITRSTGESLGLIPGQYIRIIGSVFYDGVYQYPVIDSQPETFSGAVWALAIPKEVIMLAEDIDAWRTQYEAVDSQAMSPYNSESFDGYSYSKTSGNSSGDGTAAGWKSVFKHRLNMWRKILP